MGIVHDIRCTVASVPWPRQRYCVACGHRVGRFLPYGAGRKSQSPLTSALQVIGSDVENFECPRCHAHDRERHLLLYFEAMGLSEWLPGKRILHFAPEPAVEALIESSRPASYVKCDMFPVSPDIRAVDIQSMPFADESFDLCIANHVLEHVDDDIQAVQEICRVLSPGGIAILQTPYSPVLHETWSDRGIVSEEARRLAFGQGDHVRLFGEDIFERIASAGLEPDIRSHDALLKGHDPSVAGVNAREPLFLFRKPA